ncbi:MAG: ATP-binding cassette domain-containing protein, partial [Alphaproteobacteria bacterium]|nr:ATP-binding cassette domain-containing protein [Alphaproteobacteria bacterium]
MLDRVAIDNREAVSVAADTKVAPLLPLAVRGLTLARDGRQLIDGVNFDLSSGGITMILGPNGAGKTLLLKLLHGLVEPTSGMIAWGASGNGERVRLRQAMVFQRPVLLRRSVAANIDFVLGLRRKVDTQRRDALLDHVNLLDRARQPARLLSGGEQQR